MAEVKKLEFGDQVQIFERFHLTRDRVFRILNNPDLDPDNYKKISSYLNERDQVKQFYLENEELFKEVSKVVVNLKQKFERNKNVTGYSVKNILENCSQLREFLNKVENEYSRTFTEK